MAESGPSQERQRRRGRRKPKSTGFRLLGVLIGMAALIVLFGLAGLLTGCGSKVTTSTAVSEASSTMAGATTTMAAVTPTTPATEVSNTWRNLNPAGSLPSAREGHSMVYDPTNGKVILFGGAHPLAVDETWAYDPATNTWSNLKPAGSLPSVRSGQSMIYDSGSGKVILFGGWDGTSYFNDTWAYDPNANTWTNLKPADSLPSARYSHSLVYDPGTGKVILFGGMIAIADAKNDTEVADVYADTWAYDPTANTWTNLKPTGSLPGRRANHSIVYDSGTGKVLLFGGWDGNTSHDDTWAYDPTANTWTHLNPAGSLPPARALYSMVYASGTGKVILFGGTDGSNFLNDTWVYGGKG